MFLDNYSLILVFFYPRYVLERCAGAGLKPNKMSGVFRKMFELEEKYGTSASVDKVTERVGKYVQSHAK